MLLFCEMVPHNHPHIRRRKKGLEPYPARTFWLRTLDTIVYTVGVLGPIFTIPQIIKIYAYHDASSISIVSWTAFALFNIPWIIYGFAHRERPIIITYTLWFLVNITVCAGAILYGGSII